MQVTSRIISPERHISRNRHLPLTGLDLRVPLSGTDFVLVYDYLIDETTLVESLKQALKLNPWFAGRIVDLDSKTPSVSMEGSGLLFTTANHDGPTPAFSHESPIKARMGNFINHIAADKFDDDTPILQIKFSIFSDGCILAFTISHMFCDVVPMHQFLSIWADIFNKKPGRSLNFDKNNLLNHSRTRHDPSDYFPVSLKKPFSYSPEIREKVFRLHKDRIARFQESHPTDKIGDIISAELWRIFTLCNSTGSIKNSLTMIYDVRKRLGLNKFYVGNAVCFGSVEITRDEILSLHPIALSRRIRQFREGITPEALYEDMSYWQSRWEDKTIHTWISAPLRTIIDGGIYVNNMSNIPVYATDFGKGGPCWFELSRFPFNRSALVCATPQQDGSLDVHINLPSDEMDIFSTLMKENQFLSVDGPLGQK